MKTYTRIPVNVALVGGWYAEKLGRCSLNPFTAGFDEFGEYSRDVSRVLYEHLGDLGFGEADPVAAPVVFVPQHDCRNIAATAFGAPPPIWDELSGSFWSDKASHAWAGISTLADIEKIALPNWDENPLVKENVRKWQDVQAKLGTKAASQLPLIWTHYEWVHPVTGKAVKFENYATYLDLGGFLMGSTEFLTLLASDHEVANALMHKCFEITTDLTDFMSRLYGRSSDGWCGLGGDNSCLFSPDMYREYGMGFDQLVRDRCGNVPRNLHSCGASAHLYEVWAEYPEREQIVLMQTRAIPDKMQLLRRALPHTYIELTMHQPQVDFEYESPARIKELVWEFADALEFRDMSFTVIISRVDAQCKENIAALYEAVGAVNAEAERRSPAC